MGLFDGTALERPVLCEQCGDDVKVCACEPIVEEETPAFVEPAKLRLRVRGERRKAKRFMTVVSGLDNCPETQRQELLTQLKNHCGAGGTIADSNIEIQGDHVERLSQLLREQGFRVK